MKSRCYLIAMLLGSLSLAGCYQGKWQGSFEPGTGGNVEFEAVHGGLFCIESGYIAIGNK